MSARDPEQCVYHEALARDIAEIKDSLKAIVDRLGSGDVDLATVALRVQFLEKVVYGAVGVAGVALILAILGLVLRA